MLPESSISRNKKTSRAFNIICFAIFIVVTIYEVLNFEGKYELVSINELLYSITMNATNSGRSDSTFFVFILIESLVMLYVIKKCGVFLKIIITLLRIALAFFLLNVAKY